MLSENLKIYKKKIFFYFNFNIFFFFIREKFYCEPKFKERMSFAYSYKEHIYNSLIEPAYMTIYE
jgi:hypothetical protein